MAAVTSHLRVEELQGRGRALVASRPLLAGEVVLRDSPILLYSAIPFSKQQQQRFHYCDHCFRTLNPDPSPSSSNSSSISVISCPSCSRSLFCGQNCHSAAVATSHTPWLCQALDRLRNCSSLLQQPPERQVEARFLVSAYNLAAVDPQGFQILLSLQGRDCEIDGSARFLHSILSSLCPPPPIGPGFSPELTAALISRDKLNAFGLMEPISDSDSEPSVRAYGIYPKASMFNHDCIPNACRFDYVDTAPEHNTEIAIRMIHDVPEGREVCLSYFPINMRYAERQRRLVEDYGFKCECDRCKVEVNWPQDEESGAEEEEGMDEDVKEEEMAAAEDCDQEEDDFPHAYFFYRFLCNRENCSGTLAPLPPSGGTASNVLECNSCGKFGDADEDVDGDGGEDGFSMDE